jgi:octopine/nopaline transport system substrate-binding protein
MKHTLCTFLTAGLISVAGMALADNGILRIGTEGDAPNFSMADAAGNVTGFDADVANALCAKLEMTCQFVVQSFSTLVPSMDTDRFDVIISGLGITDERREKIDYTIPYASTPQYFVVAKDSPLASAKDLDTILAGLKGKTVGVVNGTTYARFVAKMAPEATLNTYEATTQQLADLAAGRVDAALSDSPTWADFFKTPESAGYTRIDLRILPTADHETLGYGMGVGLKKGNAELQAKLDTAMCELITDGTIAASSMKWFGEDYTLPCAK